MNVSKLKLKKKRKKKLTPWLTQELEYLSSFYQTKNNAKLAGRLSMMRMSPRSPRAVANKLSLLDLTRTLAQKVSVCGVGYPKRCKCCAKQETEFCDCRFRKPKPRLLSRVYLCLEHSEYVWLEKK